MLPKGASDQVTPIDDANLVYSSLQKPHGPHIMPATGHSPMVECSELLNALMTTFLVKKCDLVSLRCV